MNVYVNGEARTVHIGCTVLEVVELICGSPVPTGVAVALNSMVVPRRQWSGTSMEDDDSLEILWASSGG